MDFIKGCKTNVRLLGSFADISYQKFSRTGPEESWSKAHNAAKKLREQSILCACRDGCIFTFRIAGSPDEDNDSRGAVMSAAATILNELGFTRVGDGTLGNDAEVPADDLAMVKTLLCQAIETSVNMTLSAQHGLLYCGQGKWLFEGLAGSGPETRNLLMEMKLDISEDNKLYATTEIRDTDLTSMTNAIRDRMVILVPFGQLAELDIAANTGSHALQESSPTLLIDALNAEGVQVDPTEQWLHVEPIGFGYSRRVPWPSRLVVGRRTTPGSSPYDEDWKKLFTKAGDENGYRDHLAFAEEWFCSGEDREKRIASEKAHGSVAPMNSSAVNLGNGEVMPAPSPASALRPAGDQLAFSGIYPTPPDGLAPVGQAQPLSMESMMPTHSSGPDNSINDFLPDADPIREQSINSLEGAQTMESQDNDLFGESNGGIDFSNGEVGDADFSFFDETPETASLSDAKKITLEQMNIDDDSMLDDGVDEVKIQSSATRPEPHPPHEEGASSNDADVKDIDNNEYKSNDSAGARPDDVGEAAAAIEEMEKPLSPFGIRERLLPPPIPASMLQQNTSQNTSQNTLSLRRRSTFEPVAFRDSLDIVSKYSALTYHDPQLPSDKLLPSIGLPAKRKRGVTTADMARNKPYVENRAREALRANSRGNDSDDGESSSDDFTSDEDDDDVVRTEFTNPPPRLPWDVKNRRHHDLDLHDYNMSQADTYSKAANDVDLEDTHLEIYQDIFAKRSDLQKDLTKNGWDTIVNKSTTMANQSELGEIQSLFAFDKLDMIFISQLAAEQQTSYLTSTASIEDREDTISNGYDRISGVYTLFETALQTVVPAASLCDISDLVVVREAQRRALTGNGLSARPGQPRPPQRMESVSLGPDISTIPPPFIRVNRGQETYEMLPTALSFWDPLSLGPVNGPKNVRAFCMLPSNHDMAKQAKAFVHDIGSAYEAGKLGSHIQERIHDEVTSRNTYDDGLVAVELEGEMTAGAALVAYMEACSILGTFLSTMARTEPDRTFVIYMIDPFNDIKSRQHLCAVFWGLCKSYREGLSKTKSPQPCSDLVLQIIPAKLFACNDLPLSSEPTHLARLAREVYDRCPPRDSKNREHYSALPNFTAPFVELAQAPPKRIGFQLISEPLNDLLHEGSTLHVAYAYSKDDDWLTAAWTDNTGRYTNTSTFCLRGKAVANAIEEVWSRTRETMQARGVFWRVYVISSHEIDVQEAQLWREVIETPRKQPFNVTLGYVRSDTRLQLRRPCAPSEDTLPQVGGGGLGGGFLTPVTTPQATNSLTVSPDASGLSNAPPTPAPSEGLTGTAEHDPDAHLFDLRDEACAMILSPQYARACDPSAFVSGMIFQRGESGSDHGGCDSADFLPALRAELVWTVQVRLQGVIDEQNVKQAEMTMRELLRLYRSLHVLTKAKGLSVGKQGHEVLPFHLVAAIKAAEGVNGLLGQEA